MKIKEKTMADIKENIKQELTKLIEQEKSALYYRRVIADKLEEHYQISAEENFIKRLERFIKSI